MPRLHCVACTLNLNATATATPTPTTTTTARLFLHCLCRLCRDVHIRLHELRRDLRDNRVTIPPNAIASASISHFNHSEANGSISL